MSRRSILVAIIAAPLIVLLDQASKMLIWNQYGPGGDRVESELLGGLLRFHFVRNTGSAFGLFQGQTGILTVATFVAIGFLVVFFYRNARENAVVALSLGLLVGGAIGNLIDRVRLGYVIDWIKLPNWPTFNVADSSITVGMVLLFLTIILQDIKQDTSGQQETELPAPHQTLSSVNED